MSAWISVKDRLPAVDSSDVIYACQQSGEVGIGMFIPQMGWVYEDCMPISGVTHWQPLPPSPEQRAAEQHQQHDADAAEQERGL